METRINPFHAVSELVTVYKLEIKVGQPAPITEVY
jgi:hypothetical protein